MQYYLVLVTLAHGGINVSVASIARCGGFIGSFMAIKLIYLKVHLSVYIAV